MLLSVVDSGTGSAARISGHQIAGKTGTTDDARDLWFVGYTTNASTAVWVGNTDNTKLYIGASSGANSGKVWRLVMTEYLKKYKPEGSFKRFPTSAYTLLLPNKDIEDDEIYLAGENCSVVSDNDYTVKTVYIRPEFAPTKTKNCTGERLSASSVIDKVKNGQISVKTAAETGYINELIVNGYADELRTLGYGDEVDRYILDNNLSQNEENIPIETEQTEIENNNFDTTENQTNTNSQNNNINNIPYNQQTPPTGLVHGIIE